MSLLNYTQDKLTALYKQYGAFFAMDDDQFNSSRVEGVQYTSLSAGLIVPKENAQHVADGIQRIFKEGIEQDLAENGREAIIKRELFNFECFYTGDIHDAAQALTSYDISYDEVKQVFLKVAPTIDD